MLKRKKRNVFKEMTLIPTEIMPILASDFSKQSEN